MKHQATPKVVLLATLFAAVGCVSSDLATEPRDPTNPAASSAPQPPRSSALSAGFDPFEAYGKATSAAPGSKREPKGNVLYVCPMHPEVQRTEPGRCPKCGMPLEPRKAEPK